MISASRAGFWDIYVGQWTDEMSESESGSAWAKAKGEGGLQGMWSVFLCS